MKKLVNLHPYYVFWTVANGHGMGHSLLLWSRWFSCLVSVGTSGISISVMANVQISECVRGMLLEARPPGVPVNVDNILSGCYCTIGRVALAIFFVGNILLGPGGKGGSLLNSDYVMDSEVRLGAVPGVCYLNQIKYNPS